VSEEAKPTNVGGNGQWGDIGRGASDLRQVCECIVTVVSSTKPIDLKKSLLAPHLGGILHRLTVI